MSYQVLARKWRPRTFREMVGQEHVLQALINALDHNRLHHAYLFTGTRGVGKTTIARILAKCLNCEAGVSSEPCGQCSACVELAEGRFIDLIEVDAASRTKVEDTRELLENVQYAPTRGRYKVYLIDEVHMLSNSSFNALLKTLEEPPPHVKFLLATTDPQKLPVTVLSRCLQFNLKNMNPERIVSHLQFVLEKEMVPFEDSALWQLGRSADGSMRDALSLTDQAIAFGRGKITEAEVRAMLGTIDQALVYDILEALASLNGKDVLAAVARLSEHSPDYSGALAELLSVLHRIAIGQALPEAVDNSSGDRDQVLQLAQKLAIEDVQLFYQTALLGRRDLPLAPDPRGGFEMVLLRMLAFKPKGVHEVPTRTLSADTSSANASAQSTQDDVPAQQAVSAAPEPVPKPEPNLEPASNKAAEPGTDNVKADMPWDEPSAPANIPPADEQLPMPTEAPGYQQSQSVQQTPVESSPADAGDAAPAKKIDAAPAITGAAVVEPKSDVAALSDTVVAEQDVVSSPDVDTNAAPDRQQPPSWESMSQAAAEAIDDVAVEGAVDDAAVDSSLDSDADSVARIPLERVTPEDWPQIYLALGVGGVLQATVANCLLVGRQGNLLQFVLDASNSTLYDPSHQQRLADLLTGYFIEPIEAHITLGEITTETPSMIAIRSRRERLQTAVQDMKADPIVQQLIEHFDAVLSEDSVKPID